MQPERARNPVSISATPTTWIIHKPYYDLPSTITVMRQLQDSVDGFEIQNLGEWNKESPPRDDVTGARYAAWKKSRKYTAEEVAALIEGLPILSVHANRDVGIYLCSNKKEDINRGKTLIHESLFLAEKVGASICVFHLWDTWKSDLDITFLQGLLGEISCEYPDVKAAVENVPTHVEGVTPFDLVKGVKWVTLDMRWAAMYNELGKFESVKDQIVNVHLRGQLHNNKWKLTQSPFEFYEGLGIIRTWGYKGVLTMEPEGNLSESTLENLVAAMASVRQ